MVPSGEVRMVPEPPIATKVLFPNPTPSRMYDVPEFLEVHVFPSVEVRMVALLPTATKVLFA